MILSLAGSGGFVPIHWYIMTSPFTDDATRKFFESHKYFGLEADQVRCFVLILILFYFYNYWFLISGIFPHSAMCSFVPYFIYLFIYFL